MSIPPSKSRCERKLSEIQALKQKSQHTEEELELLSLENYYKNILNGTAIVYVEAHAVGPIVIDEHSVMTRCNYGRDVYNHIHTGQKYVIEMPNIHTVLNVTCTFAACRAADMYIDKAVVNGQRDSGSETCTISYNYDSFDKIYYTSFDAPDACIVYSY
jgi:hypothetical protein